MKTGIDARLAKLEQRQPQKGRTFWLKCMAGDDREEIIAQQPARTWARRYRGVD